MKYINKEVLVCTALAFLLSAINIQARQCGSETAVSIQPKAIFPAADEDNKLLGFGWFKNGFVLEDETTSCTFESVFPVSGEITLNGGSLYLSSDILLENVTTLTCLGQIYGNGHILDIDTSVYEFVNSKENTKIQDLDVSLRSDLLISTTIYVNGNCNLNGRNRIIELAPDVEIVIGKNSTLSVKNVILLGLKRNNVRCLDEDSTIILDNVECVLAGNYSFTQGSFQIKNNVDLSGSYTYCFDSAQSFTISTNSRFTLSDGITGCFRTNMDTDDKDIVWFEDQTSEIGIENANIKFGDGGILLKRGTIIFDGKVSIESDATTTDKGVIFGTGSAVDDILVRFYPAARVNFNNTYLTYNLSDPDKFQSTSSYSKVIRGPTSCFYIKKNMTFKDITIKVEPTSSILVDPGMVVGYDNCTISLPTVKYVITGARFNTYTSLLNGNDEIFLNEGMLPLYTLVQNSGNYIIGNGGISGLITLYDSNAELNFDFGGKLLNYVQLNNGTVNLTNDLEFGHEKNFLGSGKVNIASNDVGFGIKDTTWAGNLYWDGSCGSINLNANASISGTWTFSGNTTIDGNSSLLDLSDSGKIIVERGSSLLLKNITLYSVKIDDLFCMDNSGTVTFQNVKIYLDGDYTFSLGKLAFSNDVSILGNSKFIYNSPNQSIILSKSTLTLDSGITFSYDPANTRKDLISFQDDTACLQLDGATLHATLTGMQLTKGSLIVKYNSTLSSEKTDFVDEGITFGNDSADEDFYCEILKGSKLEIASGSLKYRNVSANACMMENNVSGLELKNNCNLYLYQNLNITPGVLTYENNGGFFCAPGKTVNGSMHVVGYLTYRTLS
jgi:hypothetical protein